MTIHFKKKTNQSRGYLNKQAATRQWHVIMPAGPFLETPLAVIAAVFLKKSYF